MHPYRNLIIVFSVFAIALICAPLLDLLLNFLLKHAGIYAAVIIGFFYSISFTGGAAGVMLSQVESQPILFTLLAAFGSACADLAILNILRTGLKKEINQLMRICSRFRITKILNKVIHGHIQTVVAFLIIGSPLPDEFGMILLRKNVSLSGWQLLTLCYVANALCIYTIITYL